MNQSYSYLSRIYGEIDLDQTLMGVIGSKKMRRLMNISLSAIPQFLSLTSVNASRFEHSVGVMHLTRQVAKKPEFKDMANDLIFAALVHDVAMPPLCDISEPFMKFICGGGHEELAFERLSQSLTLMEMARDMGTTIETASKLINGELGVFGKIINGTIDTDNLDNINLFATSKGLIHKEYYSPEKIADMFCVHNNELCLDTARLTLEGACHQIDEWVNLRKQTYDFVYSNRNLPQGQMLSRAIDFLYRSNNLYDEFFRWDDAHAVYHLINCRKVCEEASKIMTEASDFRFYDEMFALEIEHPSVALLNLAKDSLLTRRSLADRIAVIIGAELWEVCAYIGVHKGIRQIDVPFLTENGLVEPSKSVYNPTVGIRIYLNQRFRNLDQVMYEKLIKRCVEDFLPK